MSGKTPEAYEIDEMLALDGKVILMLILLAGLIKAIKTLPGLSVMIRTKRQIAKKMYLNSSFNGCCLG